MARVGPVGLMASLPYVSEEGAKGSSVAKGGAWPQFFVAAFWGALALCGAFFLGLSPLMILALAAVTFMVSALLRSWFKARAGGFTGDFLGATEQILELALPLTFLALKRGWGL